MARGQECGSPQHCQAWRPARYAGKPETLAALSKALEKVGVRFLAKGVELPT
jgi:hypothetical protein